MNTVFKRHRLTLFLTIVLISVFFIHGCAISPRLTAEDRKKDIEYLAQWATDYSPFVKLNEQQGGIPNHEDLKPQYLKWAEEAKSNEEFLQVVYGYFSVIGAYGHGYLVPKDEIKSYLSTGYNINRTDCLKQSYWADLFYTRLLVRPPFRLVSKGGYPPIRANCAKEEYFTGDEWSNGEITIPVGSRIVKVNGMDCLSYKEYLKKNTWLRYAGTTAGNIHLITNELLIINEGKGFKGWQIDFLLPDESTVQTFVLVKNGFFSCSIADFCDPEKGNCICLELAKDVGYIRLKTFGGNITQEREQIRSFLERSKGDYRKLIIDIRSNHGGLPYFCDNFIQPFLEHPVTYKCLTGVRKKFVIDKPQWYQTFLRSAVIFNHPEIISTKVKPPSGFDEKEWTFYEITDEIKPANRYPFEGDIFVLIDGMTGSTADNFAHVIKSTKTAILIGQRTHGSVGAQFQPDIFKLPVSGIIFRVEIDLVLNPDGTYNELVGTKPDIELPCTFLPEKVTKEILLKDGWVRKIIEIEL